MCVTRDEEIAECYTVALAALSQPGRSLPPSRRRMAGYRRAATQVAVPPTI
jgi:hypothetical protein